MLVGLGVADGEGGRAVGGGLEVGEPQGGELADAQQGVGADADERGVADPGQRAGGGGDGGGRFGCGPGEPRGLAAAAVAAFAADAVEGMAHERIGGGVGGAVDLVGLGDGGAGQAHGGRREPGGVAVLEEVGDVERRGGQLPASVNGGPGAPGVPGRGVGAAGVGGQRGDRGGDAPSSAGAGSCSELSR
ncbi:MAG: hypothetical protein OXQ31_19365 [Spirochaetaceae bacterium]|nr:hypothetical protein [Spirochaetaceae bacterium]